MVGALAAGVAGVAWWSSRRGASADVPAMSNTSAASNSSLPREGSEKWTPELQRMQDEANARADAEKAAAAKKLADAKSKPAAKPDGFGKLLTTGGLAGGGTIGAGGIAAGAAGAAAWIAGNAIAGGMITGDAAGVVGAFIVGGGFSPVSVGNVGNIGRVLARDVDRALNGFGFVTGTGAGASAAYQVAGYLAGCALALGGLSLVPFVGQVVGLVLLVGQVINDADRLKFGRERYLADLTTGVRAVYVKTNEQMQRAVFSDPANMGKVVTDEATRRLQQHAAAVAWGWVQETNDGRQRAHMKRPPGLGQTAEQHAAWGAARGIFFRDFSDVSPLLDVIKLESGVDLTELPPAEREASEQSGRTLANVGVIMKCLGEPIGALQSLAAHLRYFRAQDIFTGDVDDKAFVRWGRATLDGAASKARGAPVVSVAAATEDPAAAQAAKAAEDAALVAALNAAGEARRAAEAKAAAERAATPIATAPTAPAAVAAAQLGTAPGNGLTRARDAVQVSSAAKKYF